MDYAQAKDKFIEAWGTLGANWGINRTMAQVHALLLISPASLSAEEIMEQLNISRGNVNMNVRALMEWGLVYKQLKTGERKEYFYAEKDTWKIFRQVVKERQKRELEPMFRTLEEVQAVKGDDKLTQEFKEMTENIKKFANDADSMLNKISRADENWFWNSIFKLMK